MWEPSFILLKRYDFQLDDLAVNAPLHQYIIIALKYEFKNCFQNALHTFS